MNLKEIIELVNGTPLNPEVDMNIKIRGGCGADLMSDVLASSRPKAILLTGLTNPQVVRTAQIAEIQAIVFVRGKQPQAETIEIASARWTPFAASAVRSTTSTIKPASAAASACRSATSMPLLSNLEREKK